MIQAIKQLKYAGIGSRETPHETLVIMTEIARELSHWGWLMRSGHAEGADLAFERGQTKLDGYEIHLPWEKYNGGRSEQIGFMLPFLSPEVLDIAERYHPAWNRLSVGARLLMGRNVTIILGQNLDDHVNMIICWTKNGKAVGGTGHGLRIASAYGIPVFNLAIDSDAINLARYSAQLTEDFIHGRGERRTN